jgi:hypothetical protein
MGFLAGSESKDVLLLRDVFKPFPQEQIEIALFGKRAGNCGNFVNTSKCDFHGGRYLIGFGDD